MNDDDVMWAIVFFAVLIINMIMYGFGAASRAISIKDTENRIKENGGQKAKRMIKIQEEPFRFTNTVQWISAISHVIMGWFFWEIPARAIGQALDGYINILKIISILGAGMLFVTVVLAISVLIPKRLAAKYSEAWAYALINPIYYILKIFTPFTGLVNLCASGVLFIFGIKAADGQQNVTEEDIISMVNEGQEQGVVAVSEAEMITNIFEFDDKEAGDIMIHRKAIIGIDAQTPIIDVIQFMVSEHISRYPVYRDNLDNIIGTLHQKEVFKYHTQNPEDNRPIGEVDALLRAVEFIPETRKINDIFKKMQTMKNHMVIVVDEYGQTAGLLAMEDILEEIVGNILDEYDDEEEYIEEKGKDEYLIDGMTPLEELETRFDLSFDDEEFETLNGFLIFRMGKIPEEGDEFEMDYQGWHFCVTAIKNRRIDTVMLTKETPDEERDKIFNDKIFGG